MIINDKITRLGLVKLRFCRLRFCCLHCNLLKDLIVCIKDANPHLSQVGPKCLLPTQSSQQFSPFEHPKNEFHRQPTLGLQTESPHRLDHVRSHSSLTLFIPQEGIPWVPYSENTHRKPMYGALWVATCKCTFSFHPWRAKQLQVLCGFVLTIQPHSSPTQPPGGPHCLIYWHIIGDRETLYKEIWWLWRNRNRTASYWQKNQYYQVLVSFIRKIHFLWFTFWSIPYIQFVMVMYHFPISRPPIDSC